MNTESLLKTLVVILLGVLAINFIGSQLINFAMKIAGAIEIAGS